jgi:hypothetical protein
MGGQLIRKQLFLKWSRRWDLNPRPADYESAALPLSYAGLEGIIPYSVEIVNDNFLESF